MSVDKAGTYLNVTSSSKCERVLATACLNKHGR